MPSEFDLGTLMSTNIFNNFVGNRDPRDIYTFRLLSEANINLSLTNLSADADVRIVRDRNNNGMIDADDEEVARSERASNLDESINRRLLPGNYLVDVYQFSGNTNYTLRLSTTNVSNLLLSELNLGTLNGARVRFGNVGSTNTSDLFRFALNTTSDLNVSLTGLSHDGDLRIIRDANNNSLVDAGEVIALSNRSFAFNESVELNGVAPGNYFAQIYQFSGDTHYQFEISATASDVLSSMVDLAGQFGAIDLPDIRALNNTGQAQFTLFNQGRQFASGPVAVSLYASTDDTYDSNDELLSAQSLNINLGQGQTQTYNFNFEAPTVVAPGAYHLIARIDSANRVAERNEQNNAVTQHVSAPGADVVLDWNATLLNAIQAVDTPPPLGARNQAIVHTAIYDAVNAIDRSYTPYTVNLDASVTSGASLTAAAASAAHRALSDLYPTLQSTFDAQLVRSLAEVPDGVAENLGVAIGQFVADRILSLRLNDGSTNAQVPFTPGNNPGDYEFTRADNFALLPDWSRVTPFAIPSGDTFRLDGPPAFGSVAYASELNEVQAIGSLNSTTRTADQTEVAYFWAHDRSDTFRPPGHWNQIAQTVALQEGTSLTQNARLFALLNIALADAGIAAWDAKYTHNQLRPITAIRNADNDGNSQTVGDPDWQPLLSTPPFPDYVSGHSTFGAAAAEVLTYFFGDDYAFSATSQELPGVYRSFGSFAEAAYENGISRVYGGIHVQTANLDGLSTGFAIGEYVSENVLVRTYA
jgi:membrane-associated phospholipid phosphatase